MLQFGKFVLTRAFLAALTLVIISLVVFTLMEFVPGDCAERYLAFKNTQGSGISVEDIEIERKRLGLDKPFVQRWTLWIVNAFQGEFGDSCILRVNIAQLLGTKFWLSLGICLGLKLISYLGLAMPNFLLALMIMLFSTIYFGDTLTGLFSKEYRDAEWSMDKFIDLLKHAWLPIFILGWSATAFALQTVRALMSDEIGKLYVTAAAARGIYGRRLLWRYPARHALSPIVNSLGFDLNRVFNELPIVALILTLTDAGALLIESLARSNDQQLAGAIIFLLTATIVSLNFLTDVLLAILDPRIRKSLIN